jgi:hypothetical protein
MRAYTRTNYGKLLKITFGGNFGRQLKKYIRPQSNSMDNYISENILRHLSRHDIQFARYMAKTYGDDIIKYVNFVKRIYRNNPDVFLQTTIEWLQSPERTRWHCRKFHLRRDCRCLRRRTRSVLRHRRCRQRQPQLFFFSSVLRVYSRSTSYCLAPHWIYSLGFIWRVTACGRGRHTGSGRWWGVVFFPERKLPNFQTSVEPAGPRDNHDRGGDTKCRRTRALFFCVYITQWTMNES